VKHVSVPLLGSCWHLTETSYRITLEMVLWDEAFLLGVGRAAFAGTQHSIWKRNSDKTRGQKLEPEEDCSDTSIFFHSEKCTLEVTQSCQIIYVYETIQQWLHKKTVNFFHLHVFRAAFQISSFETELHLDLLKSTFTLSYNRSNKA